MEQLTPPLRVDLAGPLFFLFFPPLDGLTAL